MCAYVGEECTGRGGNCTESLMESENPRRSSRARTVAPRVAEAFSNTPSAYAGVCSDRAVVMQR